MPTAVYVSNADSGDIDVLGMAADGTLSALQKVGVGGTAMPMAVSPCRHFLYIARRSVPMAVASFAIDAQTGALTRLGEAPLPGSMAYIATDRSGRFLFSAAFPEELVAISPIGIDGRVREAQQVIHLGSHMHEMIAAPSNRHVFASGWNGNVIRQYRFDAANGTLSENDPPTLAIRPGAYPRHFRFAPSGRFVYLLNELDATIDVLAFDAENGTLRVEQSVSSLPPGFTGEPWAADLHLTPDGRFLYSSDRRSNTLALFSVDPATGGLTALGHVTTEEQPRGFAIDSRGEQLLVVGQLSHHLTRYRIDATTGALSPVQRMPVGQNPNWVEIVDLPVS